MHKNSRSGSYISMMESLVLSYSSPLYERRTSQLMLLPIQFKYYSEFFNDSTYKALIEIYSVTGGIPKYIEDFNIEDKWNFYSNEVSKW